MSPHSNRHRCIAEEDTWHSVLGECDDERVPAFDPEGFARQLRQRFRRRVRRRRLLVGGGISVILLLAVAASPAWYRTAVSPQAVDPSGFVRLESTSAPNTTPADDVAAEVAITELDSLINQLGSDIKALKDGGRSPDQRRRLESAASRVTDQIRQRAEISVFSSST